MHKIGAGGNTLQQAGIKPGPQLFFLGQ